MSKIFIVGVLFVLVIFLYSNIMGNGNSLVGTVGSMASTLDTVVVPLEKISKKLFSFVNEEDVDFSEFNPSEFEMIDGVPLTLFRQFFDELFSGQRQIYYIGRKSVWSPEHRLFMFQDGSNCYYFYVKTTLDGYGGLLTDDSRGDDIHYVYYVGTTYDNSWHDGMQSHYLFDFATSLRAPFDPNYVINFGDQEYKF